MKIIFYFIFKSPSDDRLIFKRIPPDTGCKKDSGRRGTSPGSDTVCSVFFYSSVFLFYCFFILLFFYIYCFFILLFFYSSVLLFFYFAILMFCFSQASGVSESAAGSQTTVTSGCS